MPRDAGLPSGRRGVTAYVPTSEARQAVQGREEVILAALGINWQKRGHIQCVYPDHGGANDWRWDVQKARAYCTCSKGDDILSVLAKVENLKFEAAKVRACEMVGRHDIIRVGGTGTDAASLMAPPAAQADASLPIAYLAHRLGIGIDEVLMPSTTAVGWRALAYWDPPVGRGAKPVKAGDFPACAFATVAADGRAPHAHRIYVAPRGAGKAALGLTADGQPRNPKKSARAPDGAPSMAGRAVLWGDPHQTPHVLLAEGIETGAAIAFAHRREVEAGEIAVAAAISASGVAAWSPYPATRRVTVTADRDERPKQPGSRPTKTGEQAARRFAARMGEDRPDVAVDIALPGEPDEGTDWLDVLRADGADAVRAGIAGATACMEGQDGGGTEATPDSTEERSTLDAVMETYPLPVLNGRRLAYGRTRAGQIMLCQEVTRGRGPNVVVEHVPVASPFAITARLRNLDETGSYGLRLLLEDMDGRPRTVDIDRKALAEAGASTIRSLLLEGGVRFEEDGEIIAVAALKASHPAAEIGIVRYPGWHEVDGGRIYVAPGGEVIGVQGGKRVELSSASTLAPSVARAGTLEGWKAAAAAAVSARGCPHLALGVATGFAGVLVDLCGFDSCGVNLSGQTSAGKTTAQRLAASAWSVPDSTRPGLFQVAKTTVNGFEALAARANGTVFCLDELAHLSGREVARVIYTLAGGTGKTRMTAAATVREARRWRTYAILSSEVGLEAKIRGDGESWTGGQAVRVVDIDVSHVNRLLDASTLSRIAAVGQHHGHAGPAFVEALFARGTHQEAAELRTTILDGADQLAGIRADSATKRAALPLAILMAAGGLAQVFGLLPTGDAIQDAVLWAWNSYKASNEAVALDPAEQAISNLRQWIAERWNSTIVPVDSLDQRTRDAEAWRDGQAIYIPAKRIIEATGGNLTESLVARALSSANLIVKTKDAEHLTVGYVPRVGVVKAYALSNAELGRKQREDSVAACAGGW